MFYMGLFHKQGGCGANLYSDEFEYIRSLPPITLKCDKLALNEAIKACTGSYLYDIGVFYTDDSLGTRLPAGVDMIVSKPDSLLCRVYLEAIGTIVLPACICDDWLLITPRELFRIRNPVLACASGVAPLLKSAKVDCSRVAIVCSLGKETILVGNQVYQNRIIVDNSGKHSDMQFAFGDNKLLNQEDLLALNASLRKLFEVPSVKQEFDHAESGTPTGCGRCDSGCNESNVCRLTEFLG